LSAHFPIIYKERRLQTFGCLGRICLMTKFTKLVEASEVLTAIEKQTILTLGDEYVELKNNCSTCTRRKYICESPPVLIGKAIYESSSAQRDLFWKRIFFRRNQIINDVDAYKECLIKDISGLLPVDKVNVEKMHKKVIRPKVIIQKLEESDELELPDAKKETKESLEKPKHVEI
jgi:hypothetical protein